MSRPSFQLELGQLATIIAAPVPHLTCNVKEGLIVSKIYFDKDVKMTSLRKKVVGVIGYGNQGRAQGLNLRDSGVKVIVGNRRDAYLKMAESDGFEAFSIREAVSRSDILIIAIPDEIQEQLYKRHVAPVIRGGQVVCFASSYGYRFKCVVPPADVDVIMMSPRAMGVTVRESFEDGKGVPGFVAVGQDPSGRSLKIALALAKVGTQDQFVDARRGVQGQSVDHLVGLADDQVLLELFDALVAGKLCHVTVINDARPGEHVVEPAVVVVGHLDHPSGLSLGPGAVHDP